MDFSQAVTMLTEGWKKNHLSVGGQVVSFDREETHDSVILRFDYKPSQNYGGIFAATGATVEDAIVNLFKDLVKNHRKEIVINLQKGFITVDVTKLKSMLNRISSNFVILTK